MVKRPVVSSIRSRHTGQVGSSTREGVGGARGLAVRDEDVARVAEGDCSVDETADEALGRSAVGCFVGVGVKGSLVRSGYDEGSR